MSSVECISIDCNNTGRLIEAYLLRNDMVGLRDYNLKLNDIISIITKRIERCGGIIYLSGGDNILAFVRKENIPEIIHCVNKYTESEIQFSIGIGTDAVDAYLALKYAKALKKKTPVIYRNGKLDSTS